LKFEPGIFKTGQRKNSKGILIEDRGSNKPNWKRGECMCGEFDTLLLIFLHRLIEFENINSMTIVTYQIHDIWIYKTNFMVLMNLKTLLNEIENDSN